ncbi:hypothetical protein ACMXYO_01215 [Neptuniibacter sp. QD37_6]|uniref:hypothetical protein n=1 Tax=Neptuniibacter sp. QD37_6 TaxID=3398210 RepID=UPI0039F5908F
MPWAMTFVFSWVVAEADSDKDSPVIAVKTTPRIGCLGKLNALIEMASLNTLLAADE